MSGRVTELFRSEVGLSASAVSRLARLHGILRALRTAPTPWAELALAGGYFDQAHLSNEFRALSGLAPREFLQRAGSHSSKTGSPPSH